MANKKALTKKQCNIAMMVFNGVSVSMVATQFGVSPQTVDAILKRDDVRKMQYELAGRQMRDGCVKAARLLVKQLDDDNPWIAQNAARTILQWAREEREVEDQSITVTFDGMLNPDKAAAVVRGAMDTEGTVT